MNYQLTEHVKDALEKRRIPLEWMERVLNAPEEIADDAFDDTLEHRLARIPEFGDRVLRVVVNMTIPEPRIVTVYFDRKKSRR